MKLLNITVHMPGYKIMIIFYAIRKLFKSKTVKDERTFLMCIHAVHRLNLIFSLSFQFIWKKLEVLRNQIVNLIFSHQELLGK